MPPRPKRHRKIPVQPRAAVTRDAILDATSLLAREQGIESITTRQVLARAGVSAGTLYQYFASREALVAGWELRELERRAGPFVELLAELQRTRPPIAEAIRTAALRAVDVLADHLASYRRPDLGSFFSERRDLAELVIDAVARALEAATPTPEERALLRVPDLRVAARQSVLAVFNCTIELVLGTMDAPSQALYRAEVGEMIVRLMVADA